MAVLYSFGEKNEALTDREGILREKLDKIRKNGSFFLWIPSHNLGIAINYSHACSWIELIHCFLKFFPLRMDNYLGRVVGEVAHAGEHKP